MGGTSGGAAFYAHTAVFANTSCGARAAAVVKWDVLHAQRFHARLVPAVRRRLLALRRAGRRREAGLRGVAEGHDARLLEGGRARREGERRRARRRGAVEGPAAGGRPRAADPARAAI